jgi:hypothetical protein
VGFNPLGSLCEECHAREAEAAKALKLGDDWIPSPFPAELPRNEQTAQTSEPAFEMKPWVKTPDWLIAEAPARTGEVRFARGWKKRDERILLLVPLTEEDAQEMHRSRQDYVMATRLPDGSVVLLEQRTGCSPHNPERLINANYVPRVSLCLRVFGRSRNILVPFSEHVNDRDCLKLYSIDIEFTRPKYSSWYAYINLDENMIGVYDRRSTFLGRVTRALKEEDRAVFRVPRPPFGDLDQVWQSFQTALHKAGYVEDS